VHASGQNPVPIRAVQMHKTQPDVAPDYRMHRKHTMQSPYYESQDATLPHLMQDGVLLR